MTNPIHPRELNYPIRRQSSFKRIIKAMMPDTLHILMVLALTGLAFAVYQCGAEMWRHEVNKPLPPAITEKQRAYVKEIERRFYLAGHTWSTDGRTVEIFERGKWRRVN